MLDAALHHCPDVGEVLFQLFFAVQREFVLHHQAGQRQPGFAAVTLQVGGAAVRVWHRDRRFGLLAKVFFVDDKTAADGVVGFAVHGFVARQCGNAHAVFVQREIVRMEVHALVNRELHFVLAVSQHQSAVSIHVLNKRRNGVDINRIRQISCQTHNNGDIRMVTFTGQRK